ncbi:hypothetical protein PTSG_10538 [Salpingoeca rosetta]|uniref:Uncharacterized protein n=1 Tax=Salpingoeca rosetta (strain ATCC 50818 / BSB-021) TaxID=946362 RepID=F2URM8_SALR5|nr:uncharacterized protein PTSG_10538 [Salpingoeca rosetta]EGD80283.1 hypothetical protein PTSG_10538 [Salpingoeca rosetta]|eukprot:XP_004988073.1 hypothetical protein PTSG_10538 [Salpingoeca rosetta]
MSTECSPMARALAEKSFWPTWSETVQDKPCSIFELLHEQSRPWRSREHLRASVDSLATIDSQDDSASTGGGTRPPKHQPKRTHRRSHTLHFAPSFGCRQRDNASHAPSSEHKSNGDTSCKGVDDDVFSDDEIIHAVLGCSITSQSHGDDDDSLSQARPACHVVESSHTTAEEEQLPGRNLEQVTGGMKRTEDQDGEQDQDGAQDEDGAQDGQQLAKNPASSNNYAREEDGDGHDADDDDDDDDDDDGDDDDDADSIYDMHLLDRSTETEADRADYAHAFYCRSSHDSVIDDDESDGAEDDDALYGYHSTYQGDLPKMTGDSASELSTQHDPGSPQLPPRRYDVKKMRATTMRHRRKPSATWEVIRWPFVKLRQSFSRHRADSDASTSGVSDLSFISTDGDVHAETRAPKMRRRTMPALVAPLYTIINKSSSSPVSGRRNSEIDAKMHAGRPKPHPHRSPLCHDNTRAVLVDDSSDDDDDESDKQCATSCDNDGYTVVNP